MNVKSLRHGLYSTYTNARCRCEKCRSANASYARARSVKKRAALRRLGYNVTPHRRRKRLDFTISDLSRAVTVRKLLPKQTGA